MIKKILLSLVILIVLVVGFISWKFYFRFIVSPNQRIVISLPFAKEDDELIFINPMGETDHHTPPRGHPGLDFGWHHPAPLRAVVDGKITKIEEHFGKGYGVMERIFDIEVVSGLYAVRYGEIAPSPNLKVGMLLKKGDVLGRGGKYDQPGGLGIYYSTHWEFDYDSPIFDRLCPLTFFDSESLARINAIWDKVGQAYEGKFPEICSGFYKDKIK